MQNVFDFSLNHMHIYTGLNWIEYCYTFCFIFPYNNLGYDKTTSMVCLCIAHNTICSESARRCDTTFSKLAQTGGHVFACLFKSQYLKHCGCVFATLIGRGVQNNNR